MNKTDIVKALGELIGQEKVFADEAAILDATRDYIGFRVYQRVEEKYFVPRAACVVRPETAEEVSKILSFLNENNIDTVPKSGGSSVTQSIEPPEGGVVVDGSALSGILEINETDMSVTVLSGTPIEYLENVLNEKGLSTGHFPQSLPLAHVGGLLATRSIGQFSTFYGGIEDLVVGLEAVMPDGEIVRIKNVPRRSCGPDLRQLFVGSEGMLGFITEATLKIFKYRPDERWMRAYGIRDMAAGLDMIREIMHDGYKPAVIRLHDSAEVMMLLGMSDVVPPEHAVMLFIADGPKSVAEATGAAIEAYAKKYEAVDIGDKPVKSWLITRNDVSYHLDGKDYHTMGVIADTCEISGSWSVIGEIYEAVCKRMTEEQEGVVHIGGHSSHSYMQGTNIYFTFAFMEDNAETAQDDYMSVLSIIMEETLKRGGSIAHHHGSGKYRTRWMPEEHGSSYTLLYKLKEALDPKGIMNKGVLLVDKK